MGAEEQFAEQVVAFREWVECADTGEPAVRAALSHLLGLFQIALSLPTVDPNTRDVPAVPDSEWRRVFRACERLPVKHYGVVFDSLVVPPEEAVIGCVADDLADIYRDLVVGLQAHVSGNRELAAWHWRFTFWSHWGRHAVGAIGALREWLEQQGTT
ncbi:DUF5063 domain-containing protein [Gemmata algarum]|uniref:DUF5063 domain-containing protein n=1 Tax=Gemmata algarum TaxID=2975278 RepID=UPI0039C9F896